jgi:predicted permease
MRFGDLIDPEKGVESLIKLALVPLIIFIVFQVVVCLLAQLSPADELMAFVFLIAVSPVAYWVREQRRGRPRREARRGTERTPVLPHGRGEDR